MYDARICYRTVLALFVVCNIKKVSSAEGTFVKGTALSSKKTDVIVLTDKTFNSTVLKSDEPWLISFHAPWCGHSKRLYPEWEKVAKSLKGQVKVGSLDADKYSDIASRYDIPGYPTIKYFPSDKTKMPEEFDGNRNKRSEESIIKWVKAKLSDNRTFPKLASLKNNSTRHHIKILRVFAFILYQIVIFYNFRFVIFSSQ